MQYNSLHIIAYLQQELLAEEVSKFETELAINAQLQEEVEICKNLLQFENNSTATKEKLTKLQDVLNDIQPQYFTQKNTETQTPATKIISLKTWKMALLSAAAILAFVVFGIQYFKSTSVLNQYGNLDLISQTERGEKNNPIQELVSLLQKKKYKKALPLAKNYLYSDSTQQQAQLYYGTTLLHNAQYANSRHWLLKIASNNSIYKYKAYLLIALSYFEEKDKENYILWLQKVPAGAPEYETAQKLLQKQ